MVATRLAAGVVWVTLMACQSTRAADPFALVPQPVAVVPHEGVFRLTAGTAVVGGEIDGVALAAHLRLPTRQGDSGAGNVVLQLLATTHPEPEGAYTLDVTPTGVTIRSASAAGLFYGGVTLRQLLPRPPSTPRRRSGSRSRAATFPTRHASRGGACTWTAPGTSSPSRSSSGTSTCWRCTR